MPVAPFPAAASAVAAASPPPGAVTPVAAVLRAAGCVFAEDEARMLIAAAHSPAHLAGLVDQRVAGRPVEHVVGWAEFCGLRILVGPGVFVPRRRTEFLVQRAAALLGEPVPGGHLVDRLGAGRVVVDLGCGSGAVGAALAASASGSGMAPGPAPGAVKVHAVDIDPVAVRYARRNLAGSGGRVYQGDLFAPLPRSLRGRVHLVVANLPYVPTDQIRLLPAEARRYEARVALDGGPDGLGVLRRVAPAAPEWLAPGGRLLVETSRAQAPVAAGILGRGGLAPAVIFSEEAEATVVIGASPA